MSDQLSSIRVHAQGQYATQAVNLYNLLLSGPDDPTHNRGSGRFDQNGTCTFSRLPVGRYWVTADTRGDAPWPVRPSRAEVTCSPGRPAELVIHFGEGFGGPGAQVRNHRR